MMFYTLDEAVLIRWWPGLANLVSEVRFISLVAVRCVGLFYVHLQRSCTTLLTSSHRRNRREP